MEYWQGQIAVEISAGGPQPMLILSPPMERARTELQKPGSPFLLPFMAENALNSFRADLAEGKAAAQLFSENDGRLVEIPSHYWNSAAADAVIWEDNPAILISRHNEWRGRVVLTISDLERLLHFEGQFWKVRDNEHDLIELLLTPNADIHVDAPATAAPVLSCINRASAKSLPQSTRTAPERTRADRILSQLFPEGVPGPDLLSNANLDRSVNSRLKAEGLREVSKRTIVRAAGRERRSR